MNPGRSPGVAVGHVEGRVEDLETAPGVLVAPVNCPGPTALLPRVTSEDDLAIALELVAAYSRCDRLDGDVEISIAPRDAADGARTTRRVPRPGAEARDRFKEWQIC